MSMKLWQKLLYILIVLATFVIGGIYTLWQEENIDNLPKIALVILFAFIPVTIVLIATYFASKDKPASSKAFKI